MYRTDNPVADFNRYDQEQVKRSKKYPHCDYCGEAIYERYYYINGENICQKCLEDEFGREVED